MDTIIEKLNDLRDDVFDMVENTTTDIVSEGVIHNHNEDISDEDLKGLLLASNKDIVDMLIAALQHYKKGISVELRK